MPRRYYRRTRVVRPKKKWASNIITRNFTITPGGAAAGQIPYISLVSNSVQSSAPTPVIVKAGNFKVNADFHITDMPAGPYHLIAFVVFLPEGIAPANNTQFGNLINSHPEYILAWRQLDTAFQMTEGTQHTNIDRVTFSSRLKRNLNSGDSIVFGILDQSTTQIQTIRAQLTCQYWTCSN